VRVPSLASLLLVESVPQAAETVSFVYSNSQYPYDVQQVQGYLLPLCLGLTESQGHATLFLNFTWNLPIAE